MPLYLKLTEEDRWRPHSTQCPRCGEELRFIATLIEQPAITKILDSLGLASSPPLPQARAPDPQLDFAPVLSVA